MVRVELCFVLVAAVSNVPPFFKQLVIPVAPNEWLTIPVSIPATAGGRTIAKHWAGQESVA